MSHTFVSENIDPALMPFDPAAEMLARLRTQASNPSTPGASDIFDPSGSMGDDDDMDQDPLRPPPSALPAMLQPPSLVPFGTLVKRQVKLTDKSTVAFEQFCKTRSSDERDVLLFAHVLELIDLARKNEKADVWVVSTSLARKITSYTQAFMYSPQLTAYRGLSMAEHVLKAMRESNVADLPADEETAQCELVLSKIRDKGTNYRNILKTAVKASLEPDSETKNIGSLAHKLVSGTKIASTLQLYIRLAVIRFVMKTYLWLTEETFWLKVDDLIEQYRRDCKTTDELDALNNLIYQEDIKQFDDPANSPHTTSEAPGGWQAVVRKHSANVRPNPKNAQILSQAYSAAMATSGTKRRRIDVEERDDD
ncbi:hypothetical protein B0H15DRAFT_946065 [Mycena belliarum]|uniref:Uncharacterized protein n=1 Tax=Mycena belliarum TaxID=1033014 RepID=A0AAD6U9Z5_9AGAR|nr:hypothetical protein B0H15DRAFT_946065 [Mycena belliae]